MSDYAGRMKRLQEVMREQRADMALLGATDQMRYLTGWAEHAHKRLLGLFVPAQGEPVFVVPSINAEQAKTNPAGISAILGWEDGTGWHEAVRSLFARWNLAPDATALIDDELYSVHLLDVQALFPGLRCRPADPVLSLLRQVKTPEELAALETAAARIDDVYEELVGALTEGMAELDLQDVIMAAFKRRDTKPSFDPILAFGANTALPHHSNGATRLHQGDMVILDIGCLWDDYRSDITRTVSFGEPRDSAARTVYEIVSRAHWAAREAIRPGVTGEQADAAARQVITAAGYGPQFLHRTGHGIGLSGHEPPYIVAGNTAPLEPGMCFSIEPGIYLPGRFGVRIENIVTVTPDGVRSLNTEAPRQLRVVGS